MEDLIQNCGGDPTILDIEGQHCLHYAVDFENAKIVKFLLNKYNDFTDGESKSFCKNETKLFDKP